MGITVYARERENFTYRAGTGLRTEEEHNNLEVIDGNGRIIAVFAGQSWEAAEVTG